MNQQTTFTTGANGHSTPHDIFVLTDEQILEIEPEAQDITVSGDIAQGDSPAGVSPTADKAVQAEGQAQSAQAGLPVPPEPPEWLAETMNDPQRGAEARALWEGAQRAEKDAAAYREVFAKPEEARAAAERARVLDDIDRAYFAGDPTQRAQLAAMLMREDPAVFREMVFEGLRALKEAGHTPKTRSVADAVRRTPAITSQSPTNSAPSAQLNSYAAFERAANDELERSVGNAIERTLEEALPGLTSAGNALGVGAQHGAPLQARLAAAIRQDIEKALQGDRQLGEQVAQILSAKRLDNETRAQVVRLIGERAQQLVPSAAKRALNDWTLTTLAAHRGKSAHSDAATANREVAPAAPSARSSHGPSPQRKDAARSAQTEARERSRSRINYGKLSDEQILDL